MIVDLPPSHNLSRLINATRFHQFPTAVERQELVEIEHRAVLPEKSVCRRIARGQGGPDHLQRIIDTKGQAVRSAQSSQSDNIAIVI